MDARVAFSFVTISGVASPNDSPVPDLARDFDYTNSASPAFWDAYLKGHARAKSCLQSIALEKPSHGAVKISRR